MSHPIPSEEAGNPDLPEDARKDDSLVDPLEDNEKLVISEMGAVKMLVAKANILAWLAYLPARESISFKGATGIADPRFAY